MAYDAERYKTKIPVMDIRATFAGDLLGTTATNTNSQTSVGMRDRIEFFQKIKLTGFKALPEVAPDCGAHATSMTNYCELMLGTLVYARASVGTVAGVCADGTIITANVAAGTAMNIRYSHTTWDGTVQTMAPGAVLCSIEYQERF
ncbi:MAG: hypothetical protein HWN68_15010 [Desulfobacterales bacterium]|nr:hypothetical protein [Desulfobacterales bacterium]